ncbi:STAS domain-containing protein [Amycolatopsis sp. NPDC101161]|uniref:STAS domain-containing protein n=1 Tax=Amycolatopsis sp. NPDC101161 TaxID=3363940 RepID=UPI0038014A53
MTVDQFPRRERLEVARTRVSPGVVVLALAGELDTATAARVTRATDEVLATGDRPPVLIVDLSAVSFLSVAGVRAIHSAHDAAGHQRFRVVTGENPGVREFLHATGFDAVLNCYRSRKAALTAGSLAEFVNRAKAVRNAG